MTAISRLIESERILFIKQFFRSPLTVGSIAPSSAHLANAMLRAQIPVVPRIVEFGPGTGSFTKLILDRFPRNRDYWAFEINSKFRRALAGRFPKVNFLGDSASEAGRLLGDACGTIDLVVSGLPFANIPWDTIRRILEETHTILRPNGVFSTYIYFQTYQLPKLRRMRRYLEQQYSQVEIETIWSNFPPAFVVRCVK